MTDTDERDAANAVGARETTPPDPQSLAEEARKAVSYIASLSAGDLIQWAIAGLAEKAWEHMGLVANPATGKITRDFENARLAIDAIAALVDLLAPRIEPAGLRRLQTLLADLRINYAAQRSRCASASGQDAPRSGSAAGQDAYASQTEPPHPDTTPANAQETRP